ERQPGLLETPEIAHTAPYPSIVTAFGGKGAGKLANHECCRQAPEKRRQEQDQDCAVVAGAMHDILGAVRFAGDHKKRGGHQRPERQLDDASFRYGESLRLELGRKRYCTQFFFFSSSSDEHGS